MDVSKRKRRQEALLEVNHTLEAQAALLQSQEELLKVFVKNVPLRCLCTLILAVIGSPAHVGTTRLSGYSKMIPRTR
jgi:hypothetical protein